MNTHMKHLTPLEVISLIILAIATVIGVWAIMNRFASGLIISNLTQHVPWGIWVALYIYFIGLSAGSFLLSTLIYVFGVKKLEPVGALSLIQALFCLALGMVAIVLDLGQPLKAWLVMFPGSNTSVLAWEARFYVAYGIILIAEIFIVLRPGLADQIKVGGPLVWLYKILSLGGEFDREKWRTTTARWMFALGIIGIPVAIGVHGGTGAIFAVLKARPFWFTGLFPIVFLVSALASGGGLLTFLTAAFLKIERKKKLGILQYLARLTVGILVFDLLLLFFELLVVFYGGVPAETIPWRYTIFGPIWSWTVFWFMQFGVGIVIPSLLVLLPGSGNKIFNLGIAGFCVVFGMMATRLNIVIPAQLPVVIEGLEVAYPNNFRWDTGYFPSGNELLCTMGVLAIGIWMFFLAFKILPLHSAESHHSEGGE